MFPYNEESDLRLLQERKRLEFLWLNVHRVGERRFFLPKRNDDDDDEEFSIQENNLLGSVSSFRVEVCHRRPRGRE